MTERKLKLGQTFDYLGEHSCATIGYFPRFKWFYIDFNGICVYTSYTFRPAKKKLDTLIEKYELVEEPELDE